MTPMNLEKRGERQEGEQTRKKSIMKSRGYGKREEGTGKNKKSRREEEKNKEKQDKVRNVSL